MSSKEQAHSSGKSTLKKRTPQMRVQNHDVAAKQINPATIIQRAGLDPTSLSSRDVLQLQRTIGNRAVCRMIDENDRGAEQKSSNSAVVQRMNNPFFDPMAELEAADNESDYSEDDARQDFLDAAEQWDFDDITTPDFRKNHVVESGGEGLVNEAEKVAKDRKKPISTSVLFTDSDKANLVKEIKAKALSFEEGNEPNSLQKQKTNDDKYLFAEYEKTKKGKYRLKDAGFGRIAYAAQGVDVFGGKQYEVNHLDDVVDRQAS